jgi:hypothetical protein
MKAAQIMLAIAAAPLLAAAADAALAVGDFAFIGFNADGDDDFAIVALADITDQRVFFRDDEPNGSSGFHSFTEGTLQWDTGAGAIDAGTVVIFTDVDDESNPAFGASVGTLSEANAGMNLAGGGDGLWAYQAAAWDAGTTTLIAAVANDDYGETVVGDLGGTGLVEGTTAVEFSTTTADGGQYNGSRDNQAQWSAYPSQIANPSNWTVESSNGEAILPLDSTPFLIPEPSTAVLVAIAALALALCRRVLAQA